jgi:phytoene dehydrogenase-like protein
MTAARQFYDAVVIGSGPNGLAAAITTARAGRSVLVVEGEDTIGGGTRTAELTLPGFLHDVCSAVHPLGFGSPFFRTLPLAEHGLEWIEPPAQFAHPFDDGTAVSIERSVDLTAEKFGDDAREYSEFMRPLVAAWPKLESTVLGPPRFPRYPIAAVRFGVLAMSSASSFARRTFKNAKARAVFAGLAAHSVLPLERVPSAAFGLVLGIAAHAFGWPFPRGGSQKIADALGSYLCSLGGEIIIGTKVESFEQLPDSRVILCDVAPRQLLRIAGCGLSHKLSPGDKAGTDRKDAISERRLGPPKNQALFTKGFCSKLERYRYGPGACKVDWALDGPIPWKAAVCKRAGTVHIGGALEEIEVSERAPWQGDTAEKPFVLLAQPTVFDPTRAPAGKHVAWAYCHVPNRSQSDMAERIENQVERFAPGFRKLILKRSVITAANLELHNPNLVGGDFGGGSVELDQLLFRPTRRNYRTPAKAVYLCSASTPPGGGVHGMCGYWAAQAALRDHFGLK